MIYLQRAFIVFIALLAVAHCVLLQAAGASSSTLLWAASIYAGAAVLGGFGAIKQQFDL